MFCIAIKYDNCIRLDSAERINKDKLITLLACHISGSVNVYWDALLQPPRWSTVGSSPTQNKYLCDPETACVWLLWALCLLIVVRKVFKKVFKFLEA